MNNSTPNKIYDEINRLIKNGTPLFRVPESIKSLIYQDRRIESHEDFELLIKFILRSFKKENTKDFWVQLGEMREKKELPGRTVKRIDGHSEFVCAHDNSIQSLFQGPPYYESNLRRLFAYSKMYNLKNLLNDIYALEVEDLLVVNNLKNEIAYRYFNREFIWDSI